MGSGWRFMDKNSKLPPIGPIKEGGLHKQLGIGADKKIPASVLNAILNGKVGDTVSVGGKTVKITALLKKRANFAKNFGKKK